ncbi:MAG: UTP--glucose-1-phosphate uridylyltransferase GalU [Bacillota bacterium]|nr:UTP--glucose-1-phosphate uridylyltransferase GalU [Bacillota bacterium]
MRVRKAVIPAAGFGTRFLPATKAIPKEMLPIVDKPTIQYNIEELINAGIEEILIITGRNKEAIMNHFDKSPELETLLRKNDKLELLKISDNVSNMVNIHFVRQKEAKGLGHAILCAKAFVGKEPFAVLLGDDVVYSEKPCVKQLIDVYNEYQSSILGVQKVKEENVNKYGIIDGEKIAYKTYSVKDMIEKPEKDKAPSNIAILGRYILTPEIFEELENTKKGVGGEIQLTDGILNLSKKQEVYAYVFDGRRYDAGSKLGYLEANVEYALRHNDVKDDFKLYLKELVNTL